MEIFLAGAYQWWEKLTSCLTLLTALKHQQTDLGRSVNKLGAKPGLPAYKTLISTLKPIPGSDFAQYGQHC